LPSASDAAVGPPDVPTLLVFVRAGTEPSDELLIELRRGNDVAPHVVIAVEGTEGMAAELLAGPVLVDRLGLLPAALGVDSLPSAFLVQDGVVAAPAAIGVAEVLAALRSWTPPTVGAEAIDGDFVPRPQPAVAALSMDGVTVIGDPSTGRFHTLDGPGGLIWACFDGTASLRTIAEEISEAVGAPFEVVQRDVLDFARQLGAAGALDGVRPDDPEPAKT
jgi:hypothetical protein